MQRGPVFAQDGSLRAPYSGWKGAGRGGGRILFLMGNDLNVSIVGGGHVAICIFLVPLMRGLGAVLPLLGTGSVVLFSLPALLGGDLARLPTGGND